MQVLADFVKELDRASGLKKQEIAFGNAIKHFGYDTYNFGVVPRLDAKDTDELVLISNCDEEWLRIYREKKYFLLDPTAQHCLASNEPILWSQLGIGVDPGLLASMQEDLGSFGYKSGVTIPLFTSWSPYRFGMGLTHQGCEDFETHDERFKKNRIEIVSIARLFFQVVHARSVVETEFPITEEGHKIFKLLLLGYSRKEASEKLGINDSKMKYHIRNTVAVLNAGTSDQALAKFALLGLANPSAHTSVEFAQ